MGVVDTWTGPDVSSKVAPLFATSRNSYVPSVVGIATVQEPDDRGVLPAVRVQLLVYTKSSAGPAGAPWTYPPITYKTVGPVTLLQLTVPLPPGATALGFAVRVGGVGAADTWTGPDVASTVL